MYRSENLAVLSIALDAANSGDNEAAKMYADILRESCANGFDVAVVRAHTMIMDAVENQESRAKFAEFDAVAQRAKDDASFVRAACSLTQCPNCCTRNVCYVGGTIRTFCIECGYRLNKDRVHIDARRARDYGFDVSGLSLGIARIEREFSRFI